MRNSRMIPSLLAGTALLIWTLFLPLNGRAQGATPAWHDPSPHTVQFLTVDKNVSLEVLDWGGSGRPLVLLAGLGNTAHIFDDFAPKLTSEYHVYGITRRGYGVSSAPATGYSADRLGDDVLAVVDALKLDRPVLVGHSIGGEELSSIGTRHPERVAGLIYLDAGYSYAYYDRSRGDLNIDLQELQKKLSELEPGKEPPDRKQLVADLLGTDLPAFQRDLQDMQRNLQARPVPLPSPAPPTDADRSSYQTWISWQKTAQGFSMPEGELRQIHVTTVEGHVGDLRTKAAVGQEVVVGEQKYTDMALPVLAIFAVPHGLAPIANNDSAARIEFEARDIATSGAQADAFERGIPSARVIRLARANHYVFISNEIEVLREMRSFLSGLK